MDIRDMKLDDRTRKHLQRVENRDRRKRKCRRVDDDAAAFVDRLVDPVDQLRFAVGLAEFDGLIARRFAANCSTSASVVLP